MGLIQDLGGPLAARFAQLGLASQVGVAVGGFLLVTVVLNVLNQLLFKNPNEPPVVFHWFPVIGSTITYGMDPPRFFKENRAKVSARPFLCRGNWSAYSNGFALTARRMLHLYSPRKEDDRLRRNPRQRIYPERQDPRRLRRRNLYRSYDTRFRQGCRLRLPQLEAHGAEEGWLAELRILREREANWTVWQFMKVALTTEAFRSYVPIISDEVTSYFKRTPDFKAQSGVVDICPKMAQITIFTASHALQGKEIRDKFDVSLADLYHDLDMGFSPINFMLHWAPLPWNNRRDHAQRTVAGIYMDTIKERRAKGESDAQDIMYHLMNSTYKNGVKVPDHEIAHMMIALLMAGQHSSSSTSSWIMLRLASRPDIMEQLYQEQVKNLGADLPPLAYEDLAKLPLNQAIVKETLRLHAPIHSIMRAVKQPMPVPGTKYVIPTNHVLLAAPGVSGTDAQYFPEPDLWEPHRWEKDSPLAPSIVRNEQPDEADDDKIDYGYGLVSKGAASPYLPFGAGRHRCIGELFANVQLQTIVAETVRLFKFRNVDGSSNVIGTDYASLFSRPLEPANIHWEKRN